MITTITLFILGFVFLICFLDFTISLFGGTISGFTTICLIFSAFLFWYTYKEVYGLQDMKTENMKTENVKIIQKKITKENYKRYSHLLDKQYKFGK